MGFGSKQLLEMSAGMLVGVAAAKYIPTILPASITSALPATSFTAPLITGASTLIAYWGASKFLPSDVAKGVALGGASLTLSQVLNVVAPPNIAGPLRLNGVGDIVQTQGFSVPNRSMQPAVMPMPAAGGMGSYQRRRGR